MQYSESQSCPVLTHNFNKNNNNNTIHPLLSSLQARLTLGFLDDVTLGGPVKAVASDVAEIIRVGSELGLSL